MSNSFDCTHTSNGSSVIYDASALCTVAFRKNISEGLTVLCIPGVVVGVQLDVVPETDTEDIIMPYRTLHRISRSLYLVDLEISVSTDI